MRLLCWLGFHKWKAFNFIASHEVIESIKIGKPTVGFAQMAYFKCERCSSVRPK